MCVFKITYLLLIDNFYECRESPRSVFYFHNKMLRPIHAIQAFIKSFQMSLSGVNGRGKGNSKHRGGIISFLSGAFSLKANVHKKVLFCEQISLPANYS